MQSAGMGANNADEASDLPPRAVSAELVPSVLFSGAVNGPNRVQEVLGRSRQECAHEQAAVGTLPWRFEPTTQQGSDDGFRELKARKALLIDSWSLRSIHEHAIQSFLETLSTVLRWRCSEIRVAL